MHHRVYFCHNPTYLPPFAHRRLSRDGRTRVWIQEKGVYHELGTPLSSRLGVSPSLCICMPTRCMVISAWAQTALETEALEGIGCVCVCVCVCVCCANPTPESGPLRSFCSGPQHCVSKMPDQSATPIMDKTDEARGQVRMSPDPALRAAC